MADAGKITVQVHLDIDLNGEPITHVLEMPASIENPAATNRGLVVHLHLDGRTLAKALLPHILAEMPSAIRTRTDRRAF